MIVSLQGKSFSLLLFLFYPSVKQKVACDTLWFINLAVEAGLWILGRAPRGLHPTAIQTIRNPGTRFMLQVWHTVERRGLMWLRSCLNRDFPVRSSKRRRIRFVICTEEPWLWLCTLHCSGGIREASVRAVRDVQSDKVIWGQCQLERYWAQFPEITHPCAWILPERMYKGKKM